jgi:hypothetical protein
MGKGRISLHIKKENDIPKEIAFHCPCCGNSLIAERDTMDPQDYDLYATCTCCCEVCFNVLDWKYGRLDMGIRVKIKVQRL